MFSLLLSVILAVADELGARFGGAGAMALEGSEARPLTCSRPIQGGCET